VWDELRIKLHRFKLCFLRINKQTPWLLVRKRTISTCRPPRPAKLVATFVVRGVACLAHRIPSAVNLGFLDWCLYYLLFKSLLNYPHEAEWTRIQLHICSWVLTSCSRGSYPELAATSLSRLECNRPSASSGESRCSWGHLRPAFRCQAIHAQGAFAFLHEELDLSLVLGGLSGPYLGILASDRNSPSHSKCSYCSSSLEGDDKCI
jgi:hypothetical protein